MPVILPDLTAALQAIGNAQVYIGDPFTADGLSPLGAKNGAVTVDYGEEYSDLTAEQTGPAVHQRTLLGVSASITVPVILGDAALYAKISPTGTRSAGWSNPQAVVTTSAVLIPDAEVGGGLQYRIVGAATTPSWTRLAGNGVAGATGDAAAPKHAIWLWRATPARPGASFSRDDGGRVVVDVTFTAMFDAARPDGHKMFTVGDPAAQGVTTIRL